MSALLFVYGTLRRDVPGSRFHLLGDGAAFLGLGRVRGRLFDLGAYPGLVRADDEGVLVQGEVYRLAEEAAALARLDRYEGCDPGTPAPHEFSRREELLTLDTGEGVRAWVYWYQGPTAGARELTGSSPLRWTPRPGAVTPAGRGTGTRRCGSSPPATPPGPGASAG